MIKPVQLHVHRITEYQNSNKLAQPVVLIFLFTKAATSVVATPLLRVVIFRAHFMCNNLLTKSSTSLKSFSPSLSIQGEYCTINYLGFVAHCN